ncbi:IQ calmodulin-binding domain-containing protein [Xylariomycetidae sp. FL0641]|nr:IQ calmodulin-binding domain-containing protein [Xylariomycetidae sp. FL0641]
MRRASADLTDPSRNLEESVGTPTPTSPELDPDLEMTLHEDEEDSRIYTPPPRIAARFYRPTQIRRKESAASSRRNSISSAHSRSSHGFSRLAGPQSKYIAQQLRRASILEDRKARLADRAAHAEKVRLRAAVAKAAQQKTCNSEERALAAAQAREKNLAEIVTACAEEVKRAKAIAEGMKEKREQELHKMKLQMEERHAEAERRREELRKSQNVRRSRGQSIMTKKSGSDSVASEEEQETSSVSDRVPMSEDVAVSKIQWWWRGVSRRRAVNDFSALGLSIDGVRSTSFEKVTKLLGEEHVLLSTARVLRICGLQEGDPKSASELAAVRVFLSAFVILGHPTPILNAKDRSHQDDKGIPEQVGFSRQQHIRDNKADPQKQELVAKARDLLISFEETLSRLTLGNNYTPPPALLWSFPATFRMFSTAFIAWKARDLDSLVETLIKQFTELDAILHTVHDGTEKVVTDIYREGIKNNQIQIVARMKALLGPEKGLAVIRDALREARRERAAKKSARDRRPRATEHSLGGESSSAAARATADQVVSSHLQTLTPPSTPPSKKDLKHSILQSAYPPILPENRVMIHELAINREYRIEFDHFKEQYRLRMEPLFRDLRAGPKNEEKEFRYLMIMANYIRDRLQNLVRAGSSMHTFIGEILDTEVAQRQFRAGSFSYEKFFSAMGLLLPKLCAPVRDAEVKDLAENRLSQGDVVDRLQALISFIDVMLYDYANYMLQVSAPNLAEHAIPYEAKRFAEELEKGSITLARAEASWRAARNKVHAEAARRDPEGIHHARSRPTPDKIYWQMMLDEFTQPSASEETVPEPLALDAKRRARIGRQTIRIVTAGAILLQCKNMLKRDVRAPWRTEAGRIFGILESMDDAAKPLSQQAAAQGVMAALEAGRSMPPATKEHLQALVRKIMAASVEAKRENSDPREPVLRLLLARIRGHMLARLQAGSASEKAKTTSSAGEKLASLGLPEYAEMVRQIVDEIVKVGMVDRDAHGIWWEGIDEKIDKEESAGQQQAA